MKKIALLNLVVVLALLLAGVAYAGEDILAAAKAYFSGGTKNITAQALYENLNDGDSSNDPFILSVRTAEDYAKGHIKGAVRMDVNAVFNPENLAQLPKDKPIVVYCYTGQNASWVTAGLRMLGYDAYNLLFGMSGWSNNPEVYVRRFDPAAVPDYPVTTEAVEATETYGLPKPLADTAQAALQAALKDGPKYVQVKALFENLNDGDTSNDPFIIDVRAAEHYAKGHIAGAVNMNPKEMWDAATLAKIPTDRQVVVYCYTGQTSAQVVMALRALGYDAYSMQFGMQMWSADPAIAVNRFDASKVPGYPTEGTAAAAAEATAQPTPATLPTTGGVVFPVEGLVLGLGALSLGAGLALRRRKSA
ncbi:MAG: rhodanese-like domain-containing protein [Anaerolineae bacterium]